MKRLFFLIVLGFVFVSASAQRPGTPDLSGYRFKKRIKGPSHKKSKVLEIMVGNNNNYFAVTYKAEKSKYVYIVVYSLYTWKQVGKYKVDDNRSELYNSYFDKKGENFYVNYDIYKNKYKKINLKSKKIENVECTQTPRGCLKLEPHQYKTEAYTVGENYYIFRDEKFKNYFKIYIKKELYVPDIEDADNGENVNTQLPVIKLENTKIETDTTNIIEKADTVNINDTLNNKQ